MRRLGILALSTTLFLLLAACGTEQERNLRSAADWAEGRVSSPAFLQEVRRVAPEPKPSDAVAYFFGAAHLAGAPQPPEGISIQPAPPRQFWTVALRADDEEGTIVVECFGEDLAKPVRSVRVDWPPK